MHCTNCGSYIPEGKRFCADCGTPVSDPEETRVARTQPGYPAHAAQPNSPARAVEPILPARGGESREIEHTIFVARPTALFIGIGYAAAAMGAILLTILLSMITSRVNIPWYVVIPVSLALFLIPAYYHLRRNMIEYTLTDSSIQIDRGLLSRTTRNVPLRTIQDVTVRSSIPQRILGYGNVVIDNASEQGGQIILHNIHDPRGHADLLLRELRRWR